jgi:O-antigen ligase
MNGNTRHPETLQTSPALRLVMFGVFIAAGLIITMSSVQLFDRYGVGAVTAIVVAIPIGVAIAWGAVPEFIRNARSLRQHFGWQDWAWLFLFISAMTFEVRNLHEAMNNPLDSYVAIRAASELIVAIILAWRVASGKNSLQYLFHGLPGFVALYCLVAGISTAWSIVPAWTFFKTAEYSLDVVTAAVIYDSARTAERYEQVLNWTWTIYALETAIPWVGAVVNPANAWDELGRLFSTMPMVGPNNIGTTGAVLTLVSISRLLWRDRRGSSRAWYWAVMVYGIASMVASHTRHSFGGTLVGLIIILVLSRRKWIGVVLAGLSTPLLVFTSAGTTVTEYLRRGQSDEDLRGLTSRMDFWGYAWQQLVQHPLTGLGAYAGGRFGVLEKIGRAEAGSIHSDWVEIVMGTSFWGVLALAPAVFGTLWYLCKGAMSDLLKPLERDLAIECAGIMGLLTLHSFLNDEFVWHPPLLFLAVLGYAELIRRRLKAASAAAPAQRARSYEINVPYAPAKG